MRKLRVFVAGNDRVERWYDVDEVKGYLWFEGVYVVCVYVKGVAHFFLPLDRVMFA
jgi:hypothetical protein